ncbi:MULTISPECIES: OmpA family protein [Pontibacter]|uniref:OmpA family protein n=1 Tax=Pontibacter lucknowensis TaxID=1077936 RepID=A0A1N6YFF8_9BACT|nr:MULTISPECIES: OmpA family protein [Pontibacter]EJF10253.1 OmpA/MotB domain-containing protein [Pontibacter sp. BAB1700]SIR13290.1 OmpA family protein [Pontibacter lucknowensis]
MKKIVYTIGLILGTLTVGQAQIKLQETNVEMAGVALVGEDMLLVTKKEDGGQYLYTARLGETETTERANALNAGHINAVVGGNLAAGEVYVYHKSGRREERITKYTWTNGEFVKGEDIPVPRLRNHSYNLGLYLTEDRRHLYIAAELAGSQGYDDLYLSEWNGKSWSRPRNLGKQVNSNLAEFAPFVRNDSLYFSRQEGETAYIYGAALRDGQPGAAVRLTGMVNEKETYNAYFRKSADHTLWVTGTAKEQPRYVAYLLGDLPATAVAAPVEEPVSEPQVEVVPQQIALEEVAPAESEVIAEESVKAKPMRAATPSLVLYNEFNRVHLSLSELAGLSRFLRQQPDGTSFVIKGYSDGYGEPAAKQRVSEQRAQSVKEYIQRYFGAKDFQVEIEGEVLPGKGKAHRKTELYLVQ